MTYENLLVSVVVALITALVTAILSNHYWICQLRDKEKSELRTLFIEKKLRVYENLLQIIAKSSNSIAHLEEECHKRQADYEKILDDIIHRLYDALIADVLYMHPDIADNVIKIFSAYNGLYTCIKNNMPLDNKDRETLQQVGCSVFVIMREDIGYDKLLHDRKWRKNIGMEIFTKIEGMHK